jgi:acyl-CoA ligase (AMP-forming) (exosortase A-associated)
MSKLLFELLLDTAARTPQSISLRDKGRESDYASLADAVERVASGLCGLGLGRAERVGIYLPKQTEAVTAMFAAARAGAVFVPINSVLKGPQVGYIMRDCDVRILVTSQARLAEVQSELDSCPALRAIVLIDGAATAAESASAAGRPIISWSDLAAQTPRTFHRAIDSDMVSILYTSGSTGRPKGVVLSHRNMVTGAHSVASYLENTADDRLLAVLPFSFDYGFSQLSTGFSVGATVVLLEYLLPRDVMRALEREMITGLAGVPPLWIQIADLEWPSTVTQHLRYMTNSGGAMPKATFAKLRAAAPSTRFFLMYGLTEAFRSTYLPPAEADQRPDSMGKAIPNAEILVVRPDGTPCAPNEPGELVHRGSLVALGYWNDPQKTAERFKPIPPRESGLVIPEIAVWSGDTVRMDEDGYLYFVGRRDEMIKTSGYRVSPTEIEDAVYATGLVGDAVATGVPHSRLGQAIVVVASPAPGQVGDSESVLAALKRTLPNYMLPAAVYWRESLPRNPNGKFDRPRLAAELKDSFAAIS